MLKEVHPEYDPHEPMITSAFSEEDLRKSGGDSYEDTYKNEIADYGDTEYSKAFSIEADDILPPQKCPLRADRVSGSWCFILFPTNSSIRCLSYDK